MTLKIMSQRYGLGVRAHHLTVSAKRPIPPFRLIILALLATLVIITGCRQSNAISDAGKTVQISLSVEPSPPIVGETVLTVTLLSDRGESIEGASLQVRGDMSHAGMAPEFGEVETADGGKYRIPFKWTMGGDWILTITATLAAGEIVKDTFKFTVE